MKDFLYCLSQNNTAARPSTRLADITAEIIKSSNITIGAKNWASSLFTFGVMKLKKTETSVIYITNPVACKKAKKGVEAFFSI